MKNSTLLLLFLFVFYTPLQAQQDMKYQEIIAKAGLFHLKKDYKNAVSTFEQAFLIHQPNALNAYKAAGVYALSGDSTNAFKFLQIALEKGWTEADLLINDSYFDNLRIHSPKSWEKICTKAFSKEKEYEKTLKEPELRKKINKMTLLDQLLRYQRAQAVGEADQQFVNKLIADADQNNLKMAKVILKKYGWPKISQIGADGQNNFWLVVQHADADIYFQRSALNQMEMLKGTAEITPENYAFLYDRVQCNLNYKQLYGTQVKWTSNGEASGFRPIEKEYLANERRLKLGLEPLSIYALTYGFNYTLITKRESMKQDSADVAQARQLIDSARLYFSHKEFQKAYDAFNNASTIAGGMNDEQNYQAALLLARVAAADPDPKYKSISLDFLELLHLRGSLNLKRIQKQREFQILSTDARWSALATPELMSRNPVN